jgi:uncharacterized protein YuzE
MSYARGEVKEMRLQVCRMVYEDAIGIGPEDVVSLQEAGKILGVKSWNVSQLVDEGELTLLIDADAPKGWAWRWLLLRSEVEALAATRRPKGRGQRRGQ